MDFLDKNRNKTVCCNAFDFLRDCPDECFDAVITDPPFGIGFLYADGKEIIDNPDNYGKWLKPLISEIERVTKKGGFIAIFQSGLYNPWLYEWFSKDYLIYGACKNFLQIRPSNLLNFGMDPVMVKYKGFALTNKGWIKIIDGDYEVLRPKEIRRNLNFHVAKTSREMLKNWNHERKHPCPRPLSTIKELVENFTIEGATILDCFSGSGTLPVACVETGRTFFAVEANPEYVKISEDRINDVKQGISKRSKRGIIIEEEYLF